MVDKDKLINWLRSTTPRPTPEPCFICGRYAAITEYHHIMHIRDIADFMIKTGHYTLRKPIPTAWLCPNHHMIWHLSHSSNIARGVAGLECLSPDELTRMTELSKCVDMSVLIDMSILRAY